MSPARGRGPRKIPAINHHEVRSFTDLSLVLTCSCHEQVRPCHTALPTSLDHRGGHQQGPRECHRLRLEACVRLHHHALDPALPCFLRIDIVRCGHALALDTHFSTLPLLIHPSFRVQCRPSPLSVDIFPLYLNPLLASWKVRQCKAHFLPLFSWCDFCRAGPLRCKPTRPCRHSSRCGSRTLTSPPSPFTTLPFLSRTHSVGGVSLAFQYLPPSPLHLSFIPLHHNFPCLPVSRCVHIPPFIFDALGRLS